MQVKYVEPKVEQVFGRKMNGKATLFILEDNPLEYYYAIKPYGIWILCDRFDKDIDRNSLFGIEILQTIKEFVNSCNEVLKSE
jgi:hypothetical protein